MKIHYLQDKYYEQWNKFVTTSPQGSLFCETWYLNSLQVNYKILVVEENNAIQAGIVLVKNQTKTFSNPMLDKYLGILFANFKGNKQKIISKQYKYQIILLEELKKIRSFDYYFHPNFDNWTPFYWNGFNQQTRYTFIIDNKKHSLDEIYANFHKNCKRNITNAKKRNVVVKGGISSEILFEVVNKTFSRQGSKAPFNKKKLINYVEELLERDNFKTFGAFDSNGICISVLGIAFDDKSSYLLLNGIDVDNEIRGANALLVYQSIIFFHDKCAYYDFEGSMLPGVEQFYRRFGGELTPYMRIWNDNFFNYAKAKAKKMYKKIRYGR